MKMGLLLRLPPRTRLQKPTVAALNLHPRPCRRTDMLDITPLRPDDLRADIEPADALHAERDLDFGPLAAAEFVALVGATEASFVDEGAHFAVDEVLDCAGGRLAG